MWTRVKDGLWDCWETSSDVTGFKSHERNSKTVIAALRSMPESLEEIDLSFTTLDADMMIELGRFKALTLLNVNTCTGTLFALPPSLTKLWAGLDEVDMREFLSAVARSGIESLWLRGNAMDHALIAATIEASKLKKVTLCTESPMTARDVARYVSAAERCDVECIYFCQHTGPIADLRRTRKLIEFGDSYPDDRDYQYTHQLKVALVVRLVLVVLSARSGPAAKFLKRDGDHACMERVVKYMTSI